jgi:indole-3-glycerol phosphate synthase/phosphoribosylanthranilate isomerase
MSNILHQIVLHKQQEIKALYEKYDLEDLKTTTRATLRNFYREVAAASTPFWICEFKRKSPSEGWIDQNANVASQIRAYAGAGARAISVLTDQQFFGGTYDDLRTAAATLRELPNAPLLLQKDFVIDEIQIYLARLSGADMILLIAAILEPDRLDTLRRVAESLGMGALVEVHDQEELDKVQHLDFPVLGVNNRDLKTFRTALNRVNVITAQARGRHIISESGIHDYRDFAAVKNANGFLIGTGLMRQGAGALQQLEYSRPLLKACGIRTPELFREDTADFIGINFSPVSKRRMPLEILDPSAIPGNAVAVFYQNPEAEIIAALDKYPFRRVQLYAGDVSPEFVRKIKRKVVLACRIQSPADIERALQYAADVDFFILDGPAPGSGTPVDTAVIPAGFPYPFLLAGGIRTDNIHLIRPFDHCIGVDVASGIETDGAVDIAKIRAMLAAFQY